MSILWAMFCMLPLVIWESFYHPVGLDLEGVTFYAAVIWVNTVAWAVGRAGR